MRRNFIICIFFGLFLGFMSGVQAQVNEEVAKDTTEFIKEFEDFIELNLPDEKEELVDEFLKRWEDNLLNDSIKERVIRLTPYFHEHNARRSPHFIRLIDVMLAFNDMEHAEEHYKNWEKGLYYLVENTQYPIRNLANYLFFTNQLLRDRTVNTSASISWKVSNDDYEFKVDKGVFIGFDKVNLSCHIKDDSIAIYETKGDFEFLSRKWKGEGGLVTWEQAGYGKDEVWAKLHQYSLDMTTSSYEADSAEFVNGIYFDEPLLGKLEDEVSHVISPDRAVNPKFTSYRRLFKIENIHPDIDYEGGFSMQGANLLGLGSEENKARLWVHQNEELFMKVAADVYMFKKNRSISNSAQITLFIKGDSIYHPGIMFSYSIDDKEISLAPNDRVISKSPYYDSYHKVMLNVDRLLYRSGSEKILLTLDRGASIGNALFTSNNFYNELDFERIRMRDDRHPLVSIRNYSRAIGEEIFDAQGFATYIRYPIHQVREMLMRLTVGGFIFYDPETDVAEINQRLYDYINARLEKIDYDVLRFNSTVQLPNHNAVLDLNTNDLDVYGVERIFLSDSQNVVIFPKNRHVTLKQNRNFQFGGIINAGLFTFFGDDFFFNYDAFEVELNNIDSLRIRAQSDEKDMYNQALLFEVQNTIEKVTGDLKIDAPQNKSGLKNFPEYPVFNSREKSFVYYDDVAIHNGVYEREDFYFQLEPFTIDSLDNFTSEGLNFSGSFFSSDIFPPFEEKLVLRPDNSLGFVRPTPEGGFPLYQGKGKYYDDIDLSNQGLRGEGELAYLSSRAITDDILFFPDSTKIHASEYTIAQRTTGIEYPMVKAEGIDIKWYPYEDIMHASQTDSPFTMYNDSTRLSGNLALEPIGLTGQGTMDLKSAVLSSSHFDYKSVEFTSDTADFHLRTLDREAMAFETDNLNIHVDFGRRTGDFKANSGYTLADFPENLYLSYLDRFKWLMAQQKLEINSDPEIEEVEDEQISELARLKDDNLPGALYLSKHRSQDSLRFSSSKATFSLKESMIEATEVEFFRVADADIYPKDKLVQIGETAKMETLRKAELITDRENKYHRIYNAALNVMGRNDFRGSGDYTYVDENDDEQIIHFSDIRVDTTLKTLAQGDITQPDSFLLSPKYHFKGETHLFSDKEHLRFEGGVKLQYKCPLIPNLFVGFESEINPDSIYIPLEENLRSINGAGLYSGSFITIDSSHIYSTFVSPRRDPNDEQLVTAPGYLHYDKLKDEFVITSKEKHLAPDTTGSLVRLDTRYCELQESGKINMGIELGQIDIAPAGKVSHKLETNEIKAEMVMALDFFFSTAALDTMIVDMLEQPGLDAFDMSNPFFQEYMSELIGEKDANAFKNQIMLYGPEAVYPESAQHTMVLGDLRLNWNTATGSYIRRGSIGFATINNRPVNRYVNGYFEMLKRRSGDLFRLYFQLPNDNYYYFSYSRGVMQTLSNNEDFVDAIQEIRNRKRKLKTPRGETPYRYIISTNQNRSQFLRRMRQLEEEERRRQEEAEAAEGTGENENGGN